MHMTNFWLASMAMWLPVILAALGVILVITLRWFSYKERMALIAQGLAPESKGTAERSKTLLATGLIVGLVGLAITIALLTIGVGVWLLFGLLPLFIGLALVLSALILRPEKPKAAKEAPLEAHTTGLAQEAVGVERDQAELPNGSSDGETEEGEDDEDQPF